MFGVEHAQHSTNDVLRTLIQHDLQQRMYSISKKGMTSMPMMEKPNPNPSLFFHLLDSTSLSRWETCEYDA